MRKSNTALVCFLMAGCGGAAGSGAGGSHAHDHHGGASEPSGSSAHGHHEGHDHSGDHMAHMEAVKSALQQKLGAAYDEPLTELSTADLDRGKDLYQTNCASCHGKSGKGDGPAAAGLPSAPSDLTDTHHATFYSERARLEIIRRGIEGTPMAGWVDTLGEQGTLDVYAFARSLAQPVAEAAKPAGGEHDHGEPEAGEAPAPHEHEHHHKHDHRH